MYVDPDPECDEEGWGTVRSAVVPAVAIVAFGGSYVTTYGLDRYLTYTELLGPHGAVLQFALIAGVVVLHEGIHAAAYAIASGLSWDEIEVDVELDLEGGVDPIRHSVHPARPVRRWVYYVGIAAPGVVLGVVPSAVAVATGNPLAMFVGVVGLVLLSTDVGALVTAWRNPESIAASDPAY